MTLEELLWQRTWLIEQLAAAWGWSELEVYDAVRRDSKRPASADTHPKGGDVKQAPSLMSGAVPKADAQRR
jgi:hypothetical protein